jgi:hypothetical protein
MVLSTRLSLGLNRTDPDNMSIVITGIGNRPENLSAQAQAVRGRTAALLASFQAIRDGAVQTRLESAELRAACREARLQCRLVSERSAARRHPCISRRPEHVEIARAIVRILSEIGLPAFVLDPSHDTAIQL